MIIRHLITSQSAGLSAYPALRLQNARLFRTMREPTYKSLQDEFSVDDIEEFQGDDTTAVGHGLLRQQREMLEMFRKIETEMPLLQALQKPFEPPKISEYVVQRSMWYGGEEHPAQKKAVVVLPVSKLPLTEEWAKHKFKLLAGPRWSPEPPKDSGISTQESMELGKHGFIKISCEDLPEQAMNLKWCSDTLDKMVTEANNGTDKFADIPHDQRHIAARQRKQRLGAHTVRRSQRPSLRDFPAEWLPSIASDGRTANT